MADRLPSPAAAAPALGRLVVDLDALRANYRTLTALAPGASVAAVVKANAYGLGAAEVARALDAIGCGTFFVATVDEALELRAVLPRPAIYTLGGVPGESARLLAQADVRPVLNTLADAQAWALAGGGKPAALQVDTGMTRAGFSAPELHELLAHTELVAALDIVLLLTHLACADEPQRGENERQLLEMERLRAAFPAVATSIANSAGTLLGARFHGDIVRPGIALYGGRASATGPNPMREVVTFEARVLQRRVLEERRSVGYGATVSVPAGTAVAVLGVGYADGYPRTLGNGRGQAAFDGKLAPVLGRVSMDLTVIDVTSFAPGQPAVGDYVTLIGGAVPLEEVASAAGTLGYELLTGIGNRVRREYRGRGD